MIQRNKYDGISEGLLALTAFLSGIISLFIGFSMGLIAVVLILFLAPTLCFFRKLIPPEQRVAFILIISV